MDKFKDIDNEGLIALLAEKNTALDEFLANEAPSPEDVEAAEALDAEIAEIEAEQNSRAEAEAAVEQRATAIRERAAARKAEAEAPEEEEPEAEEEVEEEPVEEEPEAEVETEKVAAAKKPARKTAAALARKVARPKVPAKQSDMITITAASDVPDFSTGQTLDMDDVGTALVNRMKGFGTPSGDGSREDLQHFGVAKFGLQFDEDLVIDRGTDEMEVLARAANESRLPGESLTAAGGWCAPSETLYDLCAGEVVDGLISVPEVNVKRGGIKYTSGPDFSTIYTNVGFSQTEAQAISGTTKTCFEVPCPSWTDVRLDVVGLCIKAPILTNAAYPELVQRWLTGSMVAHQYKVNAAVISKIVALAGAARVMKNLGSTAGSTLEAVELLSDQLRQKYRLGLNATLEVIVPFWVKGAIRGDLSMRTGVHPDAVTDAMIAAHFSARRVNVQYVFNFGELTVTDIAYPATFDIIAYPAGTFIKGTSDVINLNAVYDAASLATNIYTALFFEQGLLVAQNCYNAVRATIPTCNAGRTGLANVAECNILP